MQSENKDNIRGRNNKRLFSDKATNSECTAAWQNCNDHDPEDNVAKPSLENVIDAKEWVDNGSRL